MNKKNITFIGVNFYPEDTAIGLYSTQMAEHLKENGYDVNVITGFPYYPQWRIDSEYIKKRTFLKEAINGINVYRYKQYVPQKPNFLKRVIHLLDFTIGSFFNMGKIKETEIIIAVVPFTSTIFLGWLLKKRTKAKLWVHVQDFEFDAALQAGVSKQKNKGLKNRAFQLLFGIERYLFSKADVASSISYLMLDKLKTKTSSKLEYFPNWVDSKTINPENYNVHPYLKSPKFKILYSGNIGDKQDWDFFVELLNKLGEKNIEIIVVGDGAKREWLINKIDNYIFVKYFPPVPFEELSNLLCSADLHILFQKETVVDTVMPSKLLGMMASGRPSLITGNDQSEVKKVIDESNGGVYESVIDIARVVGVIEMLIDDKSKVREMGANARNYVMNNYEKDKVLSSFLEKINSI